MDRGPPFGDPRKLLLSSGTYCGVVPRRTARRACRPAWRAVRRVSRRCIPAVWASACDSVRVGAAVFCDHSIERGTAVKNAAPAIIPSTPSLFMIGPP